MGVSEKRARSLQATLQAALLDSLESGSVTPVEFNRVCSALLNPTASIEVASKTTEAKSLVDSKSSGLSVQEFNDKCASVLAEHECKLVALRGFSVTRLDGSSAPIAALKKVDSLYRKSSEDLRFNGFRAPAKAYLFNAYNGN